MRRYGDGASEAIVTFGDHACGCVTIGVWVEVGAASLISVAPWPSLEARQLRQCAIAFGRGAP
jgi:hypothetical protein